MQLESRRTVGRRAGKTKKGRKDRGRGSERGRKYRKEGSKEVTSRLCSSKG